MLFKKHGNELSCNKGRHVRNQIAASLGQNHDITFHVARDRV